MATPDLQTLNGNTLQTFKCTHKQSILTHITSEPLSQIPSISDFLGVQQNPFLVLDGCKETLEPHHTLLG